MTISDNVYRGCRLSPDGARVAVLRSTAPPLVFNVTTGDTVVTLKSFMHFRNRDLAFDPTGAFIATIGKDTGTFDSHVRVWDAQTGELVGYLGRHGVESKYVTYSPSGRWIATLSDDSTARIWPVPQRPGSVGSTALPGERMRVTAFPDPATDRTTIEYTVRRRSAVTVRLLDVTGAEVIARTEPVREPGACRTTLDLGSLPTGLYLVAVTCGGERATRPLRIVR